MIEIINDISVELEYFFHNLNWTFILTLIFIIYGVQYKEDFIWFKKLTGKCKYFRMWIVGIIGILQFSFFKYLEGGFTASYFSELLRSFMVVMVFNAEIIKKLKINKEK